MTPRVLERELEAARLRATDEYRRGLTQAYNYARCYAMVRSKKGLPPLSKLLEEVKDGAAKESQQSATELLGAVQIMSGNVRDSDAEGQGVNAIVVGNLKALLSLDTTNFDKGATESEANAKKLADRLSKDLAPSQARINSLIRDFAGSKDIARALEMATAVEKVGGAAKLTASEQTRANRTVQEALDKYKALGVEAPAHLTALANATRQAKKPTDELGAGMTSLIGTAKSMAGVFGVSLGAGALVGFASSVFKAADQIGDLATQMGVSTDAAQRFQFAARQSGAEIEDVTKAVSHLNSGIGEGKDGGVAKALSGLGLQFESIRAMKPEDAFRAVIQAISEIKNPMEQAAAAAAVFGEKVGQKLLPMIREGSLKTADAARIMSEETIKRLKDAEQAWENFWGHVVTFSGEGLAAMGKQWDMFFADKKAGLSMLARILGGSMFPNASLIAPAIQDALILGTAEGVQREANANLKPTGSRWQNMFAGRHFTPIDPEEEKKRREHDKKLKEILDDLTPQGAKERIANLSEALGSVKVTDLTLTQLEKLREEFDKLEKAGGKLGATLQRFKLTAIDFSNPSEFTRRVSAAVGAMMTPGLQDISFARNGDFGFNGGLSAITGMLQAPTGLSPLSQVSFLRNGDLGFNGAFEGISNLFKPAKNDSFSKLFGGAMDMLPQTILQAATGGGNFGKSIGALFGGQLGTGLMGKNVAGVFQGGTGKQWQSMFGGKAGGMIAGLAGGIGSMGMSSLMTNGGGKGMLSNIGSYAAAGMMFGPWGAAIGAGVGAIVGAFKKGANNTKKAREEFSKSLGFENQDNLLAKLRSLGTEGEKLANAALNVVGKNDRAGNEKWMKDVTSFFDRLEKVPGKVNELTQALGRFGGAVPKELDPLLDSILGNSNLSPDLRKQLEGMKKPAWQAAQEFADRFGIDTGALGGGFNQARLGEQAFDLKHALDLFSRFEGADQKRVLRDMADEFSALASEANGVALPRAVQEFIRQVDEMGLLVDENGNRIDSSLLEFADIEDEYQKQVVSLLEQIRDLLKPPSAAPGPGTGQPSPNPPNHPPTGPVPGDPYDPTGPDPFNPPDLGALRLPDLAPFDSGSYLDAGPGTPVMVRDSGRMTMAGDGLAAMGNTYNINALDTTGFEGFLKRGGADVVARTLPAATARYVGKR